MTTAEFRKLDESKIVDTLTALRDRIQNQFPDSGLGRVADELIAVAAEVAECAEYLSKTNWPIRILAGLLIAAMFLVLYLAGPRVELPEGTHKFSDVASIARSSARKGSRAAQRGRARSRSSQRARSSISRRSSAVIRLLNGTSWWIASTRSTPALRSAVASTFPTSWSPCRIGSAK